MKRLLSKENANAKFLKIENPQAGIANRAVGIFVTGGENTPPSALRAPRIERVHERFARPFLPEGGVRQACETEPIHSAEPTVGTVVARCEKRE